MRLRALLQTASRLWQLPSTIAATRSSQQPSSPMIGLRLPSRPCSISSMEERSWSGCKSHLGSRLERPKVDGCSTDAEANSWDKLVARRAPASIHERLTPIVDLDGIDAPFTRKSLPSQRTKTPTMRGSRTEPEAKQPGSIMEMHQIRYFLALCEERSFRRAAKTCGVSQPSLTNGIKVLEEELGGDLFTRRPSIAVTHLGCTVRPRLMRIVRDAERVFEIAQSLRSRSVALAKSTGDKPPSFCE